MPLGGLNDMFGHMECMDLPLSLSTCFANPSKSKIRATNPVLVSKQCFIE